MVTFLLFYGFLGAIVWAIVTQPAYTKKMQESENQAKNANDLKTEIKELRGKIEALEKRINGDVGI
jgi:uncharacterized membrane protein